MLDAAQPDWRDHVVDARYVPRSTVAATTPGRRRSARAAGRPATDLAGVTGLAVAGDWVGPTGMLADASIVSGHAAATAVLGAAQDEEVGAAHQRGDAIVTDGAADFEAARPKLMAIAYRMLGSVTEAEDVVGDVAVRWAAADRDGVRVPEAWLVTVTTRAGTGRAAIGSAAARAVPRRVAAGAGRHR